MTYTREQESWDNAHYQEQMAESLLASMDHADAVLFCMSNRWDGVLKVIENLRPLACPA